MANESTFNTEQKGRFESLRRTWINVKGKHLGDYAWSGSHNKSAKRLGFKYTPDAADPTDNALKSGLTRHQSFFGPKGKMVNYQYKHDNHQIVYKDIQRQHMDANIIGLEHHEKFINFESIPGAPSAGNQALAHLRGLVGV